MGVKRLLIAALTLAIPFALAAVAGELIVRWATPQDLTGAWLTVGPRGLILNEAGVRARHQFGDRVVTYRINRLHQRGGEPEGGVPRVLVLGSSFTFGWLLEEGDTVPAVLQSLSDSELGMRRAQFLNASTGGWGLASYLAYLEAFGDAVDPVAVVAFLNANAFPWAVASGLYEARADDLLALEVRDATPRRARLRRELRRLPGVQWLLTHSHLAQLIRTRLAMILVSPTVPVRKYDARDRGPVDIHPPDAKTRVFAEALLRRMKAWCEARNVQLFLVSLYHYAYSPGVYEWLAPVMTDAAIPFLDLQAPIAAAVGDDVGGYFFAVDPHPNERTNALVARLAWRWLKPRLDPEIARHAARP